MLARVRPRLVTGPYPQQVARTRTRGLRDRLSARIAEIGWACKLARVSLNLAANAELSEFQVFRRALKPGIKTSAEPLLRAIDHAVPLPIVFEVVAEVGSCTMAAHKRPNEADASKQVLGDYPWGNWLARDALRQPLPVALDVAGLYRELLRTLIPQPARAGKSLRDQLDRMAQVRAAERECARPEAPLAHEPQFDRKVEVNLALRASGLLLARLRAPVTGWQEIGRHCSSRLDGTNGFNRLALNLAISFIVTLQSA